MQSMSGRQDRFSGNILLYDYLSSKRNPIFLNRNLTRALRIHQYILENGSSQGFPEADHSLRSEWKPPSWDALDDMMELESARGSFVLDIHSFKPNTNQVPVENPPARKTRSLFCADCRIQITVCPQSSDIPCKSPPAQKATIKGIDNNHTRWANIETDQITIRREDMLFSSDRGRLSFDEAYNLGLSINFDSLEDAETLHTHLGHNAAELDAQKRISTFYSDILECPDGATILPLRTSKGELDFGIEVAMYWSDTRAESILFAHNQQLKSLCQPSSYPSPPKDADPQKYELTYVYTNETLRRPGLVCPHQGCKNRKHQDIDGLRMHLFSWHDLFEYEFILDGVDDAGAECWTFEGKLSDHKADQRAGARSEEPFDIHVLAPEQPFDQKAFIRDGNDEYQRSARGSGKLTRHGTPRDVAFTFLTRKPPGEVQEIPVRQKKTFPVPKAPPGVTFFRSLTRRPLKEGEEISESGDEVDDEWIEQRKAAEFEKDTLAPESAKKLLKVLDSFMAEEDILSDVYFGDALIRFVRSKGGWIWQEDVFDAFQTKLDELVEDNIISEELKIGCLRIVQDQKPDTQQGTDLSSRLAELDVQVTETSPSAASDTLHRAPTRKRVDKGKGKARVTDTGHLTPLTADSDGDLEMRDRLLHACQDPQTELQHDPDGDLPYDLCLCGKDALAAPRTASVISCNGIVSFLNILQEQTA